MGLPFQYHSTCKLGSLVGSKVACRCMLSPSLALVFCREDKNWGHFCGPVPKERIQSTTSRKQQHWTGVLVPNWDNVVDVSSTPRLLCTRQVTFPKSSFRTYKMSSAMKPKSLICLTRWPARRGVPLMNHSITISTSSVGVMRVSKCAGAFSSTVCGRSGFRIFGWNFGLSGIWGMLLPSGSSRRRIFSRLSGCWVSSSRLRLPAMPNTCKYHEIRKACNGKPKNATVALHNLWFKRFLHIFAYSIS